VPYHTVNIVSAILVLGGVLICQTNDLTPLLLRSSLRQKRPLSNALNEVEDVGVVAEAEASLAPMRVV
jgi:hypothetical protein